MCLRPAFIDLLEHDAANRIAASTDYQSSAPTTPVNPQSYAYDNLSRLTSWGAPSSNQAYAYDPNGNRTNLTIGANSCRRRFKTDHLCRLNFDQTL
jgi:YD repeat-containing protein